MVAKGRKMLSLQTKLSKERLHVLMIVTKFFHKNLLLECNRFKLQLITIKFAFLHWI